MNRGICPGESALNDEVEEGSTALNSTVLVKASFRSLCFYLFGSKRA